MSIRTVHLTNAWHHASGGIRTFYEAMLTAATHRRRQATLIVPGARSSLRIVSRHARVYTVAAPASPVFDRRYRLLLPHHYWSAGSPIRRILEIERPDLVETCDKLTLVHLARRLRVHSARTGTARPTLVALSTERMDDGMRAQVGAAPTLAELTRWYLRRVYLDPFDAHIANSDYTADEAASLERHRLPQPMAPGPARHPWVLPNGVDVQTFTPRRRSFGRRRALLDLFDGTPSSTLIVHAGRLSHEKQVDWLVPTVVSAARAGIDARLVIAGDGPLRARIERSAARECPGRVVTLGHIDDRHALASTLASADLFLHPNPREPFGIGPLEAMAAGTPVVLPRAGGVLSYATDENSWLADPSPDGLARAVAEAMADRAERRSRAAAAIATARHLAWPAVMDRYFAAYDEIHAAANGRSTGDCLQATAHRPPTTVGARFAEVPGLTQKSPGLRLADARFAEAPQ